MICVSPVSALSSALSRSVSQFRIWGRAIMYSVIYSGGNYAYRSLCKAFLGVSIAFRDVWNQLLIKLPGLVIPSRARYKFEVRARRGTVKFFTEKRVAHLRRRKKSRRKYCLLVGKLVNHMYVNLIL